MAATHVVSMSHTQRLKLQAGRLRAAEMQAPVLKSRETGEVPPGVHLGPLEEAEAWPVTKTWSLALVLAGENPVTAHAHRAPFPCAPTGPQATRPAFFPRPTFPGAGVRGWAPLAAGLRTGPECDGETGTAPPSESYPPCPAAVGIRCPVCPLPLGPSAVDSLSGWR